MKNKELNTTKKLAWTVLFLFGLVGLQAQIVIDFDVTNPSCNGYTNGTATANPSGGLAPYQYFWSTGDPNPTIFNLNGGSYSVTVSDANGLTASNTTMVNEPAALLVEIDAALDICLGTSGTWIANASNGIAPYTYNWSNGTTGTTVSNLSPGYISVTATDANGCQTIVGRTINEPMMVEVVTTDVVCFGICDASAEIILTGGVGPFTYIWNTGSTDPSLPWIPAGDFSVTVTDSYGCTAIGSGTVSEPPPIIIDAVITGQCTDNASITVTASGGTAPFDYFWNTGATTTTLSDIGPGSYSITITDANDCKEDSTFIISGGLEINLLNQMNPTCLGGNNGFVAVDVISGFPPYSIIWSNGANTANNLNLDPGTYTVTVTDAAGCIAVDSTTLVATTNLELVLSSTAVNCDGTGGSATVEEVINGEAPFTYEWGTNPIQTTPTATDLVAGTYIVTVTDAAGCIAIGTVEVGSSSNLTILVQIDNSSCNNTNDGQITIVAVGPDAVPPLTYEWSHDPSLNSDIAANLVPDIYAVTVTDAEGCTGSADGLEVGFNSSIETDILWEVDTCMGDSILVTFSENSILTPLGTEIISWDWLFDNGLNSTDSTVQFYSTSDTIFAELIIENSMGCSDTVSELVIFNLLCDVYPDTLYLCQGDSLEIEPNLDCTGITVIEWMPDSSIISGGNTNMPIVFGMTSFPLEVVLTNSLGCMTTETVFVEVIDTSKQIIADDISYTQCDSTTLDFSTSNLDINCFSWIFEYPDMSTTGNGTNPNYTYPGLGTYTLAIVPDLPCLDTVFIEVEVGTPPNASFTVDFSPCTATIDLSFLDTSTVPTAINSWDWTFSNGETSDEQNPVLTFDSCQIIDATLVINFETGCTDTAMMTLEVPVFEDVPTLPDTLVVCASGDTISLNPNGNPSYDYNWTPANLLDDPTAANPIATINETTLFTVTIADDGCGDTCTVDLQVLVLLSEPLGLIVPDSVGVCVNTDTLLTSTTSQPSLFEWSLFSDFSDLLSQSSSFELESSIEYTVADTTVLYVRATNELGCEEVDSIYLANYEILASLDDFVNVCIGDSLFAIPIADLNPSDVVTWSPDNPIGTAPEQSAVFNVTISNDQNCVFEQEVFINVQDVTADLQVIPVLDTILLGDEVRLTATIEDDYVYTWTPSESLDDPTSPTPTAMPDEETLYLLEVIDTLTDCRGMATSQICVVNDFCGDPLIFVPNTFTPNNDGLNDVFFVRGFNIDEVELMVFNRWGEKVFETRDVNKGWDGSYNGSMASPDVYGYYLKVRCITGGEYTKKGNVTIIR